MERQKGEHASQSLLAGQRQLEIVRELVRDSRPEVSVDNPGISPEHSLEAGNRNLSSLPSHLGWGSDPLTLALRGCTLSSPPLNRSIPPVCRPQEPLSCLHPEENGSKSAVVKSVKIYPDLALAMLQHKFAAVGRLWLLMKHFDEEGKGWISRGAVVEQLTSKSSAHRICGTRHLRNLLNKGEGLFWTRSAERIWLRSVSKVASSLGVYRLYGCPVSLPIKILLLGIGELRAHFYGSFHSSRSKKCDWPNPLSRATLQDLCSISPRTQRIYEDRANISRQENIVVGGKVTAEELERRGWRHGRALFVFSDHRGLYGPPETAYLAWQLPNSYRGPHKISSKGRQKKINREIADLFTKGMTGNGYLLKTNKEGSYEADRTCYFGNGQSAALYFNQNPKKDRFWRGKPRRTSHFQVWHIFSGQKGR